MIWNCCGIFSPHPMAKVTWTPLGSLWNGWCGGKWWQINSYVEHLPADFVRVAKQKKHNYCDEISQTKVDASRLKLQHLFTKTKSVKNLRNCTTSFLFVPILSSVECTATQHQNGLFLWFISYESELIVLSSAKIKNLFTLVKLLVSCAWKTWVSWSRKSCAMDTSWGKTWDLLMSSSSRASWPWA